MKQSIKEVCSAAATVVLLLAMLFGAIAFLTISGEDTGRRAASKEWQQQAIEHGAAYYHPETGEFTWREKPEDSE